MYKLWSLITFAASLVAAPFFLLFERGRARLSERFGVWGLAGEDVVWFHGASFGEVNGLIPLMRLLREKRPTAKILLTCVSVTGLQKGQAYSDFQRLLPFDNSLWLARAMKGLKIAQVVVAETELWPSLLKELERRHISVSIVNAKISDFTFGYYKLLSRLFGPGIRYLEKILPGDRLSGERFIALGAAPEKTKVCGNSKYDLEPSIKTPDEARAVYQSLFSEVLPLIVLGSIRPGEEKIWIPAISASLARGAKFNVALAPRHKEKFNFFADALAEAGLRFVRRSAGRPASAGERIMLIDTMGELEKIYSAASLAFIGGTIENWGGHNPLEAAAYKAAIALGPYRSNIVEAAAALDERGGLISINSYADAVRAIEIMGEPQTLARLSEAAYEAWRENSGAAQRIFYEIFASSPL